MNETGGRQSIDSTKLTFEELRVHVKTKIWKRNYFTQLSSGVYLTHLSLALTELFLFVLNPVRGQDYDPGVLLQLWSGLPKPIPAVFGWAWVCCTRWGWKRLSHPDLSTLTGAPDGFESSQSAGRREWLERRLWVCPESLNHLLCGGEEVDLWCIHVP